MCSSDLGELDRGTEGAELVAQSLVCLWTVPKVLEEVLVHDEHLLQLPARWGLRENGGFK